eukprot:TRINITY_DN10334_c0_g2_i8.p2 TRINITY_DN10334_c0_g2~~TRINITY_DN10334_c0_g2_i8.p2  ORF type:complete len:195 (+),score=8.11 TRINITY_DN10334_c0_g2_i8:37-585(+)
MATQTTRSPFGGAIGGHSLPADGKSQSAEKSQSQSVLKRQKKKAKKKRKQQLQSIVQETEPTPAQANGQPTTKAAKVIEWSQVCCSSLHHVMFKCALELQRLTGKGNDTPKALARRPCRDAAMAPWLHRARSVFPRLLGEKAAMPAPQKPRLLPECILLTSIGRHHPSGTYAIPLAMALFVL